MVKKVKKIFFIFKNEIDFWLGWAGQWALEHITRTDYALLQNSPCKELSYHSVRKRGEFCGISASQHKYVNKLFSLEKKKYYFRFYI